MLTDDTRDRKRLPTKANILGAMKWLIKDAKANDSLFFHCELLVSPVDRSTHVFQTLATVGRSVTSTAMNLTDMMKVNGGDFKVP